jgi:ubiquinone/menaquinone biosynthesis C-methylase UbiE
MEIRAVTPEDIPQAYLDYYSRLADMFIRLIRPLRPRTILEAGCGEGQLTLPLLRRLPTDTKFIGVDSSKGSYVGWLDELALRASQAGFARRIRLVKADVRNITSIRPESIDVVISNELICDLPQERQLAKALKEFQRILRRGGKMIHGEWASPLEDNPRSLMVKHWPAWNPDQIFSQLERFKFHDVKATYFDTTIKFEREAALRELRTWGASPRIVRGNRRAIMQRGMRLPFEHIIDCRK